MDKPVDRKEMHMGVVIRRNEVAFAAAISIVTTAAVIVAKLAGSGGIAAFIAGAGTTGTVGYVVITNKKC
jgi:hypothetical protein